jgi:predicted nucleotidyltransferase
MNQANHNQEAEMLKSIVKELKRDLQELYNAKLKGLYLYGSYARDDADTESDVDILIILEKIGNYSDEIARTSKLVSELSLKYDKTISRVFVSWQDWEGKETPFLLNTRKEAIAA